MDAEIRDAWRSENYGRWRLLRDRASSDLLPVLRSEYPKWLFFERIVGFAADEAGELLLRLLVHNVYIKSAQMGFTEAMLQPFLLHDEMQVYPATAREYAARDVEMTRLLHEHLGPRVRPKKPSTSVKNQSPVMRKRRGRRR